MATQMIYTIQYTYLPPEAKWKRQATAYVVAESAQEAVLKLVAYEPNAAIHHVQHSSQHTRQVILHGDTTVIAGPI